MNGYADRVVVQIANAQKVRFVSKSIKAAARFWRRESKETEANGHGNIADNKNVNNRKSVTKRKRSLNKRLSVTMTY